MERWGDSTCHRSLEWGGTQLQDRSRPLSGLPCSGYPTSQNSLAPFWELTVKSVSCPMALGMHHLAN